MTFTELGAIGEFLGFFVVLATLVYLATQTKQTKEIATSQAARNVNLDFQAIWSTLGDDVEKSRLIRLAVNDWDSISKDEQMVVHSFLINLVVHFNSALVLRDKLPELKNFIVAWEDNIMGLVQCAGGRKWYETCNYLFQPEIRERVEMRLSDPDNLPPAWTDSLSWWKADPEELNEPST